MRVKEILEAPDTRDQRLHCDGGLANMNPRDVRIVHFWASEGRISLLSLDRTERCGGGPFAIEQGTERKNERERIEETRPLSLSVLSSPPLSTGTQGRRARLHKYGRSDEVCGAQSECGEEREPEGTTKGQRVEGTAREGSMKERERGEKMANEGNDGSLDRYQKRVTEAEHKGGLPPSNCPLLCGFHLLRISSIRRNNGPRREREKEYSYIGGMGHWGRFLAFFSLFLSTLRRLKKERLNDMRELALRNDFDGPRQKRVGVRERPRLWGALARKKSQILLRSKRGRRRH